MRGGPDDRDIPEVPVGLVPVLVTPDGEAMIDSTFQVEKLEGLYPDRSVVPTDPVVAFLSALLEDYGDEWLTKAMFHFRWAYDADIAKAASVLPRWRRVDVPDDEVAPLSKAFAERQIGRLYVVGSNETTGPIIEQSYREFLRTLDAVLTDQPYVLGARPSAADFALFGQLTQLSHFDPTPAAITLEESPRVYAWVDLLEDCSGVEVEEGGFVARDGVPESVRALLAHVGTYYAPFLLVNAAAVESGAERVEGEVAGAEWLQKPFPYQAKCLRWLRESHAALSPEDRAAVDGILAGSGCEVLFA